MRVNFAYSYLKVLVSRMLLTKQVSRGGELLEIARYIHAIYR